MIRSEATTETTRTVAESVAVLSQIPVGLSVVVAAGHVCAVLQNDLPVFLTHWAGWRLLMTPWQGLSTMTHLGRAFQEICQAVILYRIAAIIFECLQEQIFTSANVRSLRLIGFTGLASLCVPFLQGLSRAGWPYPRPSPTHMIRFMTLKPFRISAWLRCHSSWHGSSRKDWSFAANWTKWSEPPQTGPGSQIQKKTRPFLAGFSVVRKG